MFSLQEKAALLPEELRPLREVRCLAPLLVSPDPQAKDLPESDFAARRSGSWGRFGPGMKNGGMGEMGKCLEAPKIPKRWAHITNISLIRQQNEGLRWRQHDLVQCHRP